MCHRKYPIIEQAFQVFFIKPIIKDINMTRANVPRFNKKLTVYILMSFCNISLPPDDPVICKTISFTKKKKNTKL